MSVGMLAGCGGTVAGVAVKAPASDDANVALMDTGAYPTTQGHIFGVAGDDRIMQGLLEAHRMADFVAGPWQVASVLRQRPILDLAIHTGPIATATKVNDSLGRPFSDIAAKHGFIAGFSSMRVAAPDDPSRRALTNAVLHFPDPAAATAAAAEMAASNPTLPGDSSHQPTAMRDHPEAIATRYTRADGGSAVESFTPHGPYVLYQWAYSSGYLATTFAEGLAGVASPCRKP
jgi:hypothetical protein